jgi:hypothetical protein
MIVLKRDGSRWSVNCFPSVVEMMAVYMGNYNAGIYEIQKKIAIAKFPRTPNESYIVTDPFVNDKINNYPYSLQEREDFRKFGTEIEQKMYYGK